jgi:hypothetical protein
MVIHQPKVQHQATSSLNICAQLCGGLDVCMEYKASWVRAGVQQCWQQTRWLFKKARL